MNWGIAMTESDRENVNLNAFFAAAKRDELLEPSSELMARILNDAEAVQATSPRLEVENRSFRGVWAQFVAVIGGWPSLIGLAAATVASVWIGFSASEVLFSEGVSGLLSQNSDGYLLFLDGEDFFELEEL